MKDFELVIPAFNESENLCELIQRTVAAAEQGQLTATKFNLILVDNGSTDDTQEKLQQILQQFPHFEPWIQIVKVKTNRGYGDGIYAGLKTTKAPIIGHTHADLQCDPLDVIKAYQLYLKNPLHIIKGCRINRRPSEKVISFIFEILGMFILGIKVKEINAQPKIYPRELLNELKNSPINYCFDLYLLYRAVKKNYPIKSLSVNFPPREKGTSQWSKNFHSKIKTFFNIFLFMKNLAATEGKIRS